MGVIHAPSREDARGAGEDSAGTEVAVLGHKAGADGAARHFAVEA